MFQNEHLQPPVFNSVLLFYETNIVLLTIFDTRNMLHTFTLVSRLTEFIKIGHAGEAR